MADSVKNNARKRSVFKGKRQIIKNNKVNSMGMYTTKTLTYYKCVVTLNNFR